MLTNAQTAHLPGSQPYRKPYALVVPWGNMVHGTGWPVPYRNLKLYYTVAVPSPPADATAPAVPPQYPKKPPKESMRSQITRKDLDASLTNAQDELAQLRVNIDIAQQELTAQNILCNKPSPLRHHKELPEKRKSNVPSQSVQATEAHRQLVAVEQQYITTRNRMKTIQDLLEATRKRERRDKASGEPGIATYSARIFTIDSELLSPLPAHKHFGEIQLAREIKNSAGKREETAVNCHSMCFRLYSKFRWHLNPWKDNRIRAHHPLSSTANTNLVSTIQIRKLIPRAARTRFVAVTSALDYTAALRLKFERSVATVDGLADVYARSPLRIADFGRRHHSHWRRPEDSDGQASRLTRIGQGESVQPSGDHKRGIVLRRAGKEAMKDGEAEKVDSARAADDEKEMVLECTSDA
ncbi:hypothetical protein GGX14DRAFT_409210 [Mycena pura]|uniref:Uncharacterized protein n=1 Tax=Mycena pura TaxID=153505 RepID=A0AAD6UJG2_9AGAR|nr:hypothetical protein GGX14DRAFT_409210 [Mycena pura]